MPEPPWSEQKYGRRFIVNAALLALVCTLGWVWFNAHVKPHISILLFGGASVATAAVFGYTIFCSFVDKEEGKSAFRRMLPSKRTTVALLTLLPLLAALYLTTFTVYFNAGNAEQVKLEITADSSKAPRQVELSSTDKQRAISFFCAFRPMTLHVVAREPGGHGRLDIPLRRGLPVQLTVPEALPTKSFYVVRLVPLDDLFQLRGRREPDSRYLVRVFFPGLAEPIEHPGLSFRAIYLGAALDDLRMRSKSDRMSVAELRNRLHAIDGDISPADIDGIVAEWVDNPEFINTPELKQGDSVRVELQWPEGKSETTVKVLAELNDGYLKGSME